jgi:hypothetical protein
MSLLVAFKTDDNVLIVSDTRITPLDGRRSSFTNDSLKVVVLNTKIVVGFAGSIVIGLCGIRECASLLREGHTGETLLAALQQLTAKERSAVDFLVAHAGEGFQLARIRDGVIERELPAAWIGDSEAYNRFQEVRLTSDPGEELHRPNLTTTQFELQRMRRAMRAVIEDPSIGSVGSFCVSVVYDKNKNGFDYLGGTFIYVGRDVQIRYGENLINRMAQPIEEGGYAVSLVRPTHSGTPAFGLSFPRARLGMIYLPLQFDGAQVLHDLSPNDFARVVLERLGVEMEEPLLRHV